MSLFLYVDCQAEFIQLLLVDNTRGIEHNIATAVVLGERYDIADAVKFSKEAYETVQAVCQTTMRRCAILEGVHEETELLLCLFGGEAEDFEYLLLQLGIVDTDAATTNLNTVDDHVVGIGTDTSRIGIQQGHVLGLG